MKQPTPADALRLFLIASLGVSVFGCADKVERVGVDGEAPDATGGRDSIGEGDPVATGGTAGGEALTPIECTNPEALYGEQNGTVLCAEGYLHRSQRGVCPSNLPRDLDLTLPGHGWGGAGPQNQCTKDADCADAQHCKTLGGFGGPPYNVCQDSCTIDADCGEGRVCLCGEDFGTCAVGAVNENGGCDTDADCGDDALCLGVHLPGPCGEGSTHFVCGPLEAGCFQDDCTHQCSERDGVFSCQPTAVCGRPFLVAAEDRKAEAICRSDWCQSEQLGASGGQKEARQIAAEYYTKIALMEHASVAAFARFQLQLLSLGAPAEFIEATNQALIDETKHARLAFSLASRFGGQKIGPGVLDIGLALEESSIESILTTTILEGCVGETMAALEAQAALGVVEDEEVREVLTQIAADESRHAQLAWRVVKWILEERPALREVAARVFESALYEDQAPPNEDRRAPAYGVLGAKELSQVHAEAREKVVRPCARGLLRALSAATAGPRMNDSGRLGQSSVSTSAPM